MKVAQRLDLKNALTQNEVSVPGRSEKMVTSWLAVALDNGGKGRCCRFTMRGRTSLKVPPRRTAAK
jgi:hypothetical protein